MQKNAIALLAVMAAGIGWGSAAKAAYVALISDLPGGVLERGSGRLDLTDLTFANTNFLVASQVDPGAGTILSGFPDSLASIFEGDITGPSSFGGGTIAFAALGSGDPTGINGSADLLYVPFGFSGEDGNLAGTSFYPGATLASLGLVWGTYVWTWGSGAHADTYTLEVGAPEPSTWAMMAIGFAGLGAMAWRKRKKAPQGARPSGANI